VLLVHGYNDDHNLWSPLMARLAARGRAFVAFDLPGHGQSGGDEGVVRICADAVKIVAAARGPIDAIVGHSLGGLSAALAVSEGLKADKVVIAATARDRHRRLDGFAAEHGLDARTIEELQAFHAARFGSRDLRMGIPDLEGLRGDALIIHSHDDERVPVDASETTHRVWPGSELWLIRGPNHRNTARVTEVVDRIADFVG
jgi:pimeloyl-ACP methyl ester carboxylesterase